MCVRRSRRGDFGTNFQSSSNYLHVIYKHKKTYAIWAGPSNYTKCPIRGESHSLVICIHVCRSGVIMQFVMLDSKSL